MSDELDNQDTLTKASKHISWSRKPSAVHITVSKVPNHGLKVGDVIEITKSEDPKLKGRRAKVHYAEEDNFDAIVRIDPDGTPIYKGERLVGNVDWSQNLGVCEECDG